MNLNKDQSKAIFHNKGPLLIVAGAGTGKTTVITQKIFNLISAKGVNSDNILAITFTQKAAEEMMTRLDKIMPLGYEEPWLGTFHGICDRLLRAESLEVGLDSDSEILNTSNQWALVKNNLSKFDLNYYRPLGNPAKFISSMLSFFSKIQDENISNRQLDEFLFSLKTKSKKPEEKEVYQKYQELISAYYTYQQLKISNSLLDFGDLIQKTIYLLKNRPSILKKYQQQFKYIFIDEFQDTNYAQYELIKLLAPSSSSPNLIVVGDDDQSIYKFRGASISNILNFKNDYPKAKEVVLSTNYRSTQNILDASYNLIKNNNPDRLEEKLKINKKLKSTIAQKNGNLKVINVNTSQDEVDFVIETIIKLASKEQYTFKDFSILARANSQLQSFVLGLKRSGIPYQLISNRGLFDQEEVSQLINFLEVLINPKDDLTLFSLLHFKSFNLEPSLILENIQFAKNNSITLWEVIDNNPEFDLFVSMIKAYQAKTKSQSTSQILYDFIISSDYIKFLTKEDTVENGLKIKNINLFFEKIKAFENSSPKSSVLSFVETLNLWLESGENPAQSTIEDIDTVSLMTVHASKGLEFPVVFITNLVSGRFPSTNRKEPIEFPAELIQEILPEGKSSIQEERRLMYVAMTRAKDYLFCTLAKDYGGVRSRRPSGFLPETKITQSSWDNPNSIAKFSLPNSPITTHLDKKGRIEIKSLSYTQIDTFKGCPLKYKYRYILKIPTLPYHTLTFGRSVHETLYEFHRLAQQDKHLSEDEFINLFTSKFDESGYDSAHHKELRFQKAIEDLKNYYKIHKNIFGNPVHLERSFKLKIDNITINGKIDRIDQGKDGFEIIDYKTGQQKDQKKVDRDDQLSLYALASSEVFNINPHKLSLYYIESGEKIETHRSAKDLKSIKAKLSKDIQKLLQSDFPASPNKIRCNYCEYNKICPFRAK